MLLLKDIELMLKEEWMVYLRFVSDFEENQPFFEFCSSSCLIAFNCWVSSFFSRSTRSNSISDILSSSLILNMVVWDWIFVSASNSLALKLSSISLLRSCA